MALDPVLLIVVLTACDDLEELIRTFLGGSPLKEASCILQPVSRVVMVYG